MVKIITERLASISYKFAKENNIALFPSDIIYKDKVLKDDDDKSATEFLKKLVDIDEIPTTSVPPVKEIEKAFRRATKETDQAVYTSASSKLTGIGNAGRKAAEKLRNEGKDIRVFDTGTVVSMEGMFAYQAQKLSENGQKIDQILENLGKIKKERRIVEYGVVETLKYLEKGGRIGKAKSMLASLFSFKPVITAQNGVLEPIGKVRTNSQGVEKVVEMIRQDVNRLKPKKLEVMYDFGVTDEFVREVVDPKIRDKFNPNIISFNQISTTIACHLGPRVWGVCVCFS